MTPGTPARLPQAEASLARITGSIRSRLVRSHVVAVTTSTLIYAAGGFFLLLLLLLSIGGYTLDGIVRLVPQFMGLTVFVLVQILLITLCGMVVARIAASVVSRPMLDQITELEAGSIAVAGGNLERRVAIVTDDELGRLAGRFNYLTDQLGAAERQRRAFVANISHDLRTPIAIIRGHLDAQLDPGSSGEVTPEVSFAAIEHEIETLSRLIDDLFTHSRIDEGVLPVALYPIDVGTLVEQAVQGIRAYALNQSRVSVNARVPDGGVPPALGDATRTTQVLNNLLHNAVRHTPEGGVVLAEVESAPGTGWVRVIIRDTGVGIPPENLDRVFERYYQGEAIQAKGGSGLGLSIVKKLVEMQGGSVGIESTVGVGTSIWFRLPAAVGA